MRYPSVSKRLQAGFTLVELIIVIVIIGILAAVAIPKLSGLTEEADKAKNTAVLGALKSAWTIAYAKSYPGTAPAAKISGANPAADHIAFEMADPTCTASGNVITCGATATTYSTTFTYTPGSTPAIVCTTATKCQ